ncbi:MAG: M14 family zinc carboxypeptidase [Candidatus Palauibacterales bacterium]|nr:M14 family zinc carboxypeptidase [Candidatus Palauibacterales bacterium]
MTVGSLSPARALLGTLLLALGLAVQAQAVDAQQVQSPEEFFGHRMGADRQLAHWDQLVEYYRHLDEASPRLRLREMGPATNGEPYVVLFVSSEENLSRLDELREINALLSDPRGASDAEVERAIADGKAVVAQSFGLHSNEVAATQTAALFTYESVSREDETMRRIRENTISVIFPSLNPSGTALITEWYRRTKGTDHEGVSMPWLYHPYIGHDNNRDAYMQNTVESRYTGRILFREWLPQAYIDHHEMGNDGPRFYVPPYSEPIRPDGDPLVWREMDWYGAHMAYKLEEEGIEGVINYALYSGWGHFGWHWITPFHNVAGMLTESARTGRYATPTYFNPDHLEGNSRNFREYEVQTNFPSPWEGGWWRVRDIVEQQKLSAVAALDIAARNRETVLRNAYLKATRQTERGAEGDPAAAYVIPADQHDPLTTAKMVNRLLLQGIEVRRAESEFTHEGTVYGPGTHVVTLAQPKRGVIRWLLGRTFYLDNHFTRSDDGSPIHPYDLSTHTMYEFMGVRVDPVETQVDASTRVVTGQLDPAGEVQAGSAGYVLDGRLNDAFHAVNLLWDEGVAVRRVDRPASGSGLRPGDFLLGPDAPSGALSRVAEETGVDFAPLDADPGSGARPVERLRIGMYQPYWGGNMDEGWTRLMLENFGFPYDTLFDADVTSGTLGQEYDVVILPEEDPETMLGPDPDGYELLPPEEYRSGFGEEGARALDAFVRGGGTLVTFGESGELAIEHLDLPVENAVAGLPDTAFWSPGSTLRVDVDNTRPLAYGMPDRAYALFMQGNHAYRTIFHHDSDRVSRPLTYPERDILQSGWLLGEDAIAGRAAAVTVGHGQGTVVLIGFRPQFRHTTHGTFKLVFNALVSGPPEGGLAGTASEE